MTLSPVAVPKAAVAGKIDPSRVGLTERQVEVLRLMAQGDDIIRIETVLEDLAQALLKEKAA